MSKKAYCGECKYCETNQWTVWSGEGRCCHAKHVILHDIPYGRVRKYRSLKHWNSNNDCTLFEPWEVKVGRWQRFKKWCKKQWQAIKEDYKRSQTDP